MMCHFKKIIWKKAVCDVNLRFSTTFVTTVLLEDRQQLQQLALKKRDDTTEKPLKSQIRRWAPLSCLYAKYKATLSSQLACDDDKCLSAPLWFTY